MRRAITAVSTLVVLVVTVAEVHAREWQVRVDGSGEFTTIGAAIDAASEGDTISIGPGDYSGEVLAPILKSLSIVAADPNQRPRLPELDVRRVEQFDLDGIEIHGESHAGMYSQAIRTRIQNCTMSDNPESGLVFWADSVWVRNCTFERNRGGDHLNFPQPGGAIKFVGRGPDPLLVVESCTFVENGTLVDSGAIGLEVGSLEVRNSYFYGNEARRGAAIYILISRPGDRFTIESNTFVKNVASDTVIYVDGDAFTYINNNIFAFNDCFGYWVEGFGTCGCNLFWKNRSWGQSHQEWGGYCEWAQLHESNEIIDPGFCNRREDDYTLTATSPGLPENFTPLFREQGCTGLVGAFEMGCQESPTREASWGELKRLLGGEVEDSLGRGEKEERGGR